MVDYHQHILPLDQVVPVSQSSNDQTRQSKGTNFNEETPKTTSDRRKLNSKLSKFNSRKRRQTEDESESTTTEANQDTTKPNQTENENPTEAPEETTIKTETENIDNSTESPDPDQKLLNELDDLWRMSYNATQAFNVSNLSIKQMYKAYKGIEQGGPQSSIYKTFCKHYSSNFKPPPNSNSSCDQSFYALVCPIVIKSYEEMKTCLNGGKPTEVETTTTEIETTPETVTVSEMNDTKTVNESIDSPKSDTEVLTSEEAGSGAANGVAIGFVIVILIALGIGGFVVYRKVQKNRYRSQEFLLTDSVFRYDGYAQVDET